MSDDLQNLGDMVNAILAQRIPTPELIRDQIDLVRRLYPDVTDEQAEQLARRFEHQHGVTMGLGSTLEDTGFEKWLESTRQNVNFCYWDRYRRLLGDKGFSGRVLANLDQLTDRTLGLLENPRKDGRWDRRGMVVGHVQSGKTANYIGLIAKAADVGYRVIIVIAGIHNNLRSQTQARVDEGFIGFDSSMLQSRRAGAQSIIGVGRYDSTRRPSAFTNTLRDFNRQTATGVGIPLENLNQPAVFVIKKNPSTLRNLLDWLKEHNARRGASSISSPMLLIDDEADNASINISKGQDEVSRINGQIRQLLDTFDRKCYVGYTATPFANIFIDPDSGDEMYGADLFPRNFIVSLEPPSNYFGPERVFLSDEGSNGEFWDSPVRYIDDSEDILPLRHKIDHQICALPRTLLDAIRAFVLSRAIRLERGHQGFHHSMLVNASRFTSVQSQLTAEIHGFVDTLRQHLRINGANSVPQAIRDPEIASLRSVFDAEYENSGVSWPQVQARLMESVSPVTVVEINSKSSGSLDYEGYNANGLSVIAVGGFSLSRGLTLEGLTISYFLRNSMMYDTLMQMGRWFGYRPGYEDLCRVWMPEEAEGWYAHIAESVEELRAEFRRMESVNATPQEFGLKVRSHPDTLVVTARNKMGSGEKRVVQIGLANQFAETSVLLRDKESVDGNRRAAKRLAQNLRAQGWAPEDGEAVSGGRLVKSAPASQVVEFLRAFRNHPQSSPLTASEPVIRHIEDRIETELAEWDIFFPGLSNASANSLIDQSLGIQIVCQRRAEGDQRSDDHTLYITNKARVSSRGVEAVGLSDNEREQAKKNFREETSPPRESDRLNYPDRVYRAVRKRPLLIVHLLAIGKDGEDLSGAEPVVAWSISFPETELKEKKTEYVVNTTWFRERFGAEEAEEEIGGDDD
ncbi:Z1 domain-containing protein [Salinisphaera orenii]|uniref:Z1 domain-containing protein n=1 Tax=Salinisphaera orenii TaxID=856731 RepID=UPI000DBE1723